MGKWLAIVAFWSILGVSAAFAEGDGTAQRPPQPSAEDLKIIAMLDILQMMELAEEMDMVKEIDYLIEDRHDEQ